MSPWRQGNSALVMALAGNKADLAADKRQVGRCKSTLTA